MDTTIENQQVTNSSVMEDVSKTPVKFWKVSVFKKKFTDPADNSKFEKGEHMEDIYVEARKRNWAERLGVVCTADYWGHNTGDLMSESEQIKSGNLDVKQFRIVMGVKKEEHDYKNKVNE